MNLRDFAGWAAIIGTCLLTASFFAFLAYHCLKKTSAESSWLLKILEAHFAATVAVPLSAISSACVVLLLGVANGGDLSFEAGFLSFKGASGPVTLWLTCFVSMIAAVKLLWGSGNTAREDLPDTKNTQSGAAQQGDAADSASPRR